MPRWSPLRARKTRASSLGKPPAARDPSGGGAIGVVASQTAPNLLLPELGLGRSIEDVKSAEESDKEASTTTDTHAESTGEAAMPMLTSSRNVSGPLAIESPAMVPDASPAPPSWSRANSHAAAQQSKTSQYIDKITSENEKLKRELRAEKLAREDEAKRVSAARSRAEDSRAEHQHLQLLVDTNERALERKDRKLEDYKAQLEQESKRRKVAEQRAEEALKMLGDTRSETQRQLAAAYEAKHLAETNADAARDGYKRITDAYDKKLKQINDELNELRRQRYEDADKIKRQTIISDQLQHELSRTLRSESKMVDMMGQYKQEQRKEVDDMVKEAERMRLVLPEKENRATQLVTDLEQTRDKMRWVMAQKQRQGNS